VSYTARAHRRTGVPQPGCGAARPAERRRHRGPTGEQSGGARPKSWP